MADHIELTRETIDSAEVLKTVQSTQSGAIVLFLGTVREFTHGQQTVALDYEGYPEMAVAQMQELAEQARKRWPIDRLAMVHRLGHLELGETSVAVAVSCPHRIDAFAAGQWLIDTLKVKVPIWKKENWSDGRTEWVHPGADDESAPQPK